MAENKGSFLLHTNIIHTVRKLSKNRQAELFMAILGYVNDENPVIEDTMVDLVFTPIKLQLKIDLKKWEEKTGKYSTSGREGGIKSGESRRKKAAEAKYIKSVENEAKRSGASNDKANEAVYDSVYDSVYDNVNVNEGEAPSQNENLETDLPTAYIMQQKFIQENPGYSSMPSRDMPAILDIGLFIYQQAGGQRKELHEIDIGERQMLLNEWEKWCKWYSLNGNDKPLDYILKFKLQEIHSKIKNGKNGQNGATKTNWKSVTAEPKTDLDYATGL